jgi:NAD(P)-dependent dehydrogenase (short-subunit alcohol dehydrogenase family)
MSDGDGGETMRLKDKVVVITGGARGIGRAAAECCAADGAAVVIGDLLAEQGEATAAAIAAAGGRVRFVPTDVTSEAECRRLITTAVETFGRLDVLITCAGILRGDWVPVEELDDAVFASVLDVNVRGTFLCVKHAVPHLPKPGGVVICLASGAGVRGGSSSMAYGASKGGVHGLTLALEPHLAERGIRVHDVCPGGIATDMKLNNIGNLAERKGESRQAAMEAARATLGDPIGVGRVLAFLASDDADYVRGSIHTR